ncbi:MAG: hypothetical protein LUE92_11620 [Clostridiales bacterium]|nr:hypothetical protein [Clostridiales bacterium]
MFGHDLVHIACCNDDVRPVIFKLEHYEDDEEPVFGAGYIIKADSGVKV